MRRIRLANESDLSTIVEIYNSSIPNRLATADTQPVSVESRVQWLRDRPENRPIWVIEIDATIVGWLSFNSFYGRPAYRATVEVSIYVAISHHRQGVGSELLADAIRQSPELGIKTLLGFIFAHNYPSLRLFKSFGFQRWGYLPKVAELDLVERDLVIMGLRIPDV